MVEIRRTTVPVADCFDEVYVLRLLPPEHRIVATRPDATRGLTDYLIEGPLVPDAVETVPVFTMTSVSSDKIRFTGRWEAGGEEWVVGEWSSMEAFLEDNKGWTLRS